jgi:hypothetical protein
MTTDDILELEWYFGGGAEADLGVRSIQSGFEATMDRLACTERGRCARETWIYGEAVWLEADQPARETRSTCSASDDAIERLYHRRSKLEVAGKVFARLRRIKARDRAVLELHFGDPTRIEGVSLALLCQTTAVLDATALVNDRRRKRAEKAGEPQPDDVGPRRALERMATSPSQTERAALRMLAVEAVDVLRSAVSAYEEAR